jgi:hypothetical protein
MSQAANRPGIELTEGNASGGSRGPRFGLDRFTLLIAGGALALVGLLLVIILAQPRNSEPLDESSPAGVVHNFYLALLHEDSLTAYSYLSAEARSTLPYEQFARQLPVRDVPPRIRIIDERIDGDTARVTVRRTYPARGGFFPFGSGESSVEQTIVLRREEGVWKLAPGPTPGYFPYGW